MFITPLDQPPITNPSPPLFPNLTTTDPAHIKYQSEIKVGNAKAPCCCSISRNHKWGLHQCRSQEGGRGARGGWGSAPNPGATSPQECCWGLCPQPPAGAPPQTPLGATAPRPCSERGWVGSGPAASLPQPRAVRARYASPQSPPAKLDSDKVGSSRRTKPVGLIESCTQGVGAPSP